MRRRPTRVLGSVAQVSIVQQAIIFSHSQDTGCFLRAGWGAEPSLKILAVNTIPVYKYALSPMGGQPCAPQVGDPECPQGALSAPREPQAWLTGEAIPQLIEARLP